MDASFVGRGIPGIPSTCWGCSYGDARELNLVCQELLALPVLWEVGFPREREALMEKGVLHFTVSYLVIVDCDLN